MAMKVFTAAQDEDRGEPIAFAIEFTWADGKAEQEVFHAVPMIDAGIGMMVSSLTIVDEDGKQSMAPPNVREFFGRVLLPDDRRRFFALLDDPNRFVKGPLLGEIFRWLLEEYGARPTRPS